MRLNLIGQTLGKYHILGEIGRGGMGVVYKARSICKGQPLSTPLRLTDDTTLYDDLRERRGN